MRHAIERRPAQGFGCRVAPLNPQHIAAMRALERGEAVCTLCGDPASSYNPGHDEYACELHVQHLATFHRLHPDREAL